MLTKKAIRRHTVVIHKNGTFYGRVIRVLPDGRIFWLCCGYHFHITKSEDLEVRGYKGRIIQKWNKVRQESVERFSPMTTLRQLKKRARQFHGEFAHNTPLDYHHISFD